MELTQQEIKWVKNMVAEKESFKLASIKNNKIEKARFDVVKRHEIELKKLAEEGKIEERKALIEEMTIEANEAEQAAIVA